MSAKSSGSNTEQLSVKQRRVAARAFHWQSLLQAYFHDTIEAQIVKFFLLVASKEEPIELTEVVSALKLTKAAVSRTFYKLEKGKDGDSGYDYVKYVPDYNDRRKTLIALTEKGMAVAKDLTDYLTKIEETKDN
jgi:DNA-binding MarR family transcriptional regulator